MCLSLFIILCQLVYNREYWGKILYMNDLITREERENCLKFLMNEINSTNDEDRLNSLNLIVKTLKSNLYGLNYTCIHSDEYNLLKEKNPVLVLDKDRSIITSEQLNNNLLIEGDNLHSLKVLQEKYNSQIDIIYLDPPYNTGNDGFVYKDNFEHSYWLTFMKERLDIAYELLSDEGVIFISIDDNEHANLKKLCDGIFGEKNFISNFIWKKQNGGKNDSAFVSVEAEYILCYAKYKSNIKFNKCKIGEDKLYKLEDEYLETRGHHSLRKLDSNLTYSSSMDYIIKAPDGTEVVPGGDMDKYKQRQSGNVKTKDWIWRWSEKKFQWGIENGYIVFKKVKDKWSVYYKQYNLVDNKGNSRERVVPYSNILDKWTTGSGTKELKGILPDVNFPYPKDSDMIKYLLNLHTKKDAIVLDFFAGSGTTGQAVLELNKEDGGTRRFILCTNNENNICENVTYNRLKTVITGKRLDGSKFSDGILSNLLYFNVKLLEKDEESYI